MHQRWSAPVLVGLCAALLASCGSLSGSCSGFAASYGDDVETSGTPQEALEVWLEGYNEHADPPLGSDGWTAVEDPSMPGQGVDLSQGRQSVHVMIINGGWIVDAGTTCP